MSRARLTRRSFVGGLGAASVMPVAAGLLVDLQGPHVGMPPATPTPAPAADVALPAAPPAAYRFFDAGEARCIEALCERLIPADADGPGAGGAGVPYYLDAQLAGAWGGGERVYRDDAWQPGTLRHDYEGPVLPRAVFRTALAAIDAHFARTGSFAAAPPALQDDYLRALAAGRASLGEVAPAVFFDLLMKMTMEGYFCHPLHGAARHTLAWGMLGYPGACAHLRA